METQPGKVVVRPPRLLEVLAVALTPNAMRREIDAHLSECYVSPQNCLRELARGLPVLLVKQVRRAFDVRLAGAEACVRAVAFAGAPVVPLSIVIAGALLVLTVRDGYRCRAPGEPQESALDAIIAATFESRRQLSSGCSRPIWRCPATWAFAAPSLAC